MRYRPAKSVYMASLLQLLQHLGMTQEAVGTRLGARRDLVSRWMTGNRAVPERYWDRLFALLPTAIRDARRRIPAAERAAFWTHDVAPYFQAWTQELRANRLRLFGEFVRGAAMLGAVTEGSPTPEDFPPARLQGIRAITQRLLVTLDRLLGLEELEDEVQRQAGTLTPTAPGDAHD